jgi:predicted transcriptional regulator of viral defense system
MVGMLVDCGGEARGAISLRAKQRHTAETYQAIKRTACPSKIRRVYYLDDNADGSQDSLLVPPSFLFSSSQR